MILKFKYGADICIDTAEIYNVYGIKIDESDGSCDVLNEFNFVMAHCNIKKVKELSYIRYDEYDRLCGMMKNLVENGKLHKKFKGYGEI